MIIREAIPSDSAALIRLTALSPMKGTISLRIDRNPDFFDLLKERGNYKVFVAVDDAGGIKGSFASALQYFCINKHFEPVHYLCDLKIHPDYRHTTLAYRLIKEMYAYLKNENADLVFCTAAHGNDPVMNFFGGRAGIPVFKTMAKYLVYQVLPLSSGDTPIPDKVNNEKMVEFYSRFYRPYFFRPAIIQINHCDHFVQYNGNRITAAISLYDPIQLKQNVLVGYPNSIRIALGLMRLAKKVFHLPALPVRNETLKILYIKYFGFAAGFENDFLALLQKVRRFACRNNYHFISVAIDEKDALLNKLIRPVSKFHFVSAGMISSLKNNFSLIENICNHVSYEDFSLV